MTATNFFGFVHAETAENETTLTVAPAFAKLKEELGFVKKLTDAYTRQFRKAGHVRSLKHQVAIGFTLQSV